MVQVIWSLFTKSLALLQETFYLSVIYAKNAYRLEEYQYV